MIINNTKLGLGLTMFVSRIDLVQMALYVKKNNTEYSIFSPNYNRTHVYINQYIN